MASFDIFKDDAFSMQSLTKAINEQPYVPGRLGALGLFEEDGVTTTTVSVEKVGETLALVPAASRGAPGQNVTGDKRSMVDFPTVHLPQTATIGADEVQGVRAFGSEIELETIQNVVNKRLAKMRRRLDATIEYQRIGAIKGQILDANGSTVIVDMFTKFGLAQQTKSLVLGTSTTKVRTKVLEAKRLMEDALGNAMYTGVRGLCSPAFFDALTTHDLVEKFFINWQSNETMRQDVRAGFLFAGVLWEEYRGTVGGVDFITSGDAYIVPEGVPDMFVTAFAPADYVEAANTIGLPYYAKQELVRMGKGVEVEAQSNPISLCTRPRAVIKLTVS
jgi:Phage major capsid protein E